MGWMITGALFEIVWAIGLKMSEGFTDPFFSVVTVISIFISFAFFTKALTVVDISTGYAIFTGIGAAGTAIAGMVLLGDAFDLKKIFFIALLLTGVLGLKLSGETAGDKKGVS
ncbi:multidrug efflux SMR transporter [Salimicrobium sp. PL1-032A]|uniref:DMT family transporter n=1 Tax=Salimicrobium sp. PL1-032A TaxID=3095364 RepID=UPI003261620F